MNPTPHSIETVRTPHVEQRFTSRIKKAVNGCIEWTGRLDIGGYGTLSVNSRAIKAHRVSYMLYKGQIPEGLQIDHLCRNRKCVNPEHLEAVTQKINVLRGESPTAKNARKTHCWHGHELTKENTFYFTDRPFRCCKICYSTKTRMVPKDFKERTTKAHPVTKISPDGTRTDYVSTVEAGKANGLSHQAISRVARGFNRKTKSGDDYFYTESLPDAYKK